MLPTVDDLAVLEFEDDAIADVQALAVSLRGTALEADHAAVITCEQLLQLGLDGAL